MKPLNVKQLESLLKAEPFKYISLVDRDGSTVVAFNTPRLKIADRKKEIIEKLHSTIIPDGLYYLCYKEQIENSNIKRYPVAKGNVSLSEVEQVKSIQEKTIEKIVMKDENVLSWTQALNFQSQILKLEIENANLKLENERLNEELDEMEEGEGLQEGSENVMNENFISTLFDKVTPLVDKYFDNRERELSAMEGLSKKNVARPPAVVIPRATTTTQTPTQTPTQAPAPQVIYAPYTPSASTGGATQPGEPDTTEIENQLMQMSVEDLKDIYEGLKKAGKFNDLKIFIRVLKSGRPDDLDEIVKKDVTKNGS